MERLLADAARLFRRLQRGSYTIGSLTIVSDPARRILIVRSRLHSHWSLPGGFQKRREEPAETAARELREETGLTGLEFTEAGHRMQPGARHIDFVFRAELDDGVPTVHRRWSEIAEIRLLSIAEAWPLLDGAGRAAYRLALVDADHLPPAPTGG